jgi:hypothetical protein
VRAAQDPHRAEPGVPLLIAGHGCPAGGPTEYGNHRVHHHRQEQRLRRHDFGRTPPPDPRNWHAFGPRSSKRAGARSRKSDGLELLKSIAARHRRAFHGLANQQRCLCVMGNSKRPSPKTRKDWLIQERGQGPYSPAIAQRNAGLIFARKHRSSCGRGFVDTRLQSIESSSSRHREIAPAADNNLSAFSR